MLVYEVQEVFADVQLMREDVFIQKSFFSSHECKICMLIYRSRYASNNPTQFIEKTVPIH